MMRRARSLQSEPHQHLSLAHRRIVVTRALPQAGELVDLLRSRGAQTLLYPCIVIATASPVEPLDDALCAAARGEFDWLVLTSANTVYALAQRVVALGIDLSTTDGLQVAAVGPATAKAVQTELGLRVRPVPDEHRAEALAQIMPVTSESRVLLPQSDIARPTLARALEAAGAHVVTVTAYRTVIGGGGANLPALLRQGRVDAVTFTSSSAVMNCMQRLTAEGGVIRDLADVCIACIGPSTQGTAREYGLMTIAPQTYTLDKLVRIIEDYFHDR